MIFTLVTEELINKTAANTVNLFVVLMTFNTPVMANVLLLWFEYSMNIILHTFLEMTFLQF